MEAKKGKNTIPFILNKKHNEEEKKRHDRVPASMTKKHLHKIGRDIQFGE